MDSLFSQVRASASKANEAERKKIIDGLRDLAFSIESPEDTMQRIMFQVSQLPRSSEPFTGFERYHLCIA